MTARTTRPRNAGTVPRLLALGALAVVAVLAPGLLQQAATSVGQLLGPLAVALAELLEQAIVQPLLDGLEQDMKGPRD